MPLFELFQLTKAKLESSQERKPSRPEDDDIVELVWENGQLSMQNQSNKPRNIPPSNSLSSRTVQTHTPKEKDVTNGSDAKIDKFGTVDSVLNEIPLSEPSVEMGLSQDDDIVPWLDYPLDGSLQSGYGSDFLPEVSGVTENEHDIPNQTTFSSFDRRISGSQSVMASHRPSVCNGSNSEQRTPLKIAADEAARPICDTSQASSSRSNRLQTCSPHLNSRISENVNSNMMFSAIHQAVCEESGQAPTSAGCFAGIKIQKQDPALLPNNRSFINFSHFLRPVASAKANLQNMGVKGNSGLLSPEKMGGKDNGTAASSSNPADSTFVEPGSGLEKETSSHCQPILAPFMVGLKEIETKAVDKDASSKNYQNFCWGIGESVARKGPEVERTAETVIACSSVCSGNSLEGASDDPARSLKRKHSDVQDSECHSEDVEEESVDAKKAAPRIGLSSKRSRSAEVHNLSERKRRDRINEKMRALQELIPNCNKVDKASMLDEAIEYLKTLQLQVQIMSMGAGYYMPPMMLPAGMQHMHAAHVAHFSPMGVGVGVGMGMGMGMGYGIGMPDMSGGSPQGPMVQMPPIHGTQFLGTPLSGPAALHGRAGSRMQPLGVSGQGLPVAMPHAPVVPVPGPGGSLVNSTMGENGCAVVDPTKNLDTLGDSSSKDPTRNIRTQAAQSSGSHISMNQTSDQSQPQAMNDASEPPDEALEANRNGAFNK